MINIKVFKCTLGRTSVSHKGIKLTITCVLYISSSGEYYAIAPTCPTSTEVNSLRECSDVSLKCGEYCVSHLLIIIRYI